MRALAALVLLTLVQPSYAAVSQDDHEKLSNIRTILEANDELESPSVNGEGLMKEASTIAGEELDRAGLEKATETFWAKVSGFITFVNIIWVSAAIIGVIAICWLCGLYLISILKAIPPPVYEVLIYAVCFGAIVGAWWLPAQYKVMLALPGCLGLIGAYNFTYLLHFIGLENWRPIRENYIETPRGRKFQSPEEWNKFWRWVGENYVNLCCWDLFVVWSIVAVVYSSQVIGFIAIMALCAALGFMAGLMPFVIFIGFKDDAAMARTTIVGLLMLIVYLIIEVGGLHVAGYEFFAPGVAFMGTFVYFLGLITVASKYYKGKDWDNFIPMQFAAIGSGIAALYFGSTYSLSSLLGVGGTFFYIYLLEKYFEIPWKGKGWAWALLILSGILYVFAVVATKNPEYFIFMPNG